MNIFNNAVNETVTVDGLVFKGYIASQLCDDCGHALIHSSNYNADFCPRCNHWKDEDFVASHYSKKRPHRPLPMK